MVRRPGHSPHGFVLLCLLVLVALSSLSRDAVSEAEVRRWLRAIAVARAEAPPPVNHGLERGILRIGDAVLDVEVARTPAERSLGLSNRDSLPEGTGMLFEYDREARLSLWMKDMKFALDMLWFDSGRRLVHVKRNVTPETYPETFGSPVPVMYALELPAGYAESVGIEIGDTFTWE